MGVRTRRVANRLAKALRVGAKSLQRSQNALGAFFRRMAYKLGYQEAVTAVAHKLARIIYAMLKYKRQFNPAVLDIKSEFKEMKKMKSITQKAKSMGYKLIPISEPQTV